MGLGRRYSLISGTPQDSRQTGQLCPQGRICVPWSLAPGSEEQGPSPRQQTNWAKNPWAAPEGGRQRERRAQSFLPLPPWRIGNGRWSGVSSLRAGGKPSGSSDPWSRLLA